MKVFLSWSGGKSRAVAEALREWLPKVLQEVEPFISAGVRWQYLISEALEGSSVGILCVTRENQSAPWLNFEAGAIAKQVESARVIPLAIDLTVADVKPPLGHFQAKEMSASGIFAVLESINGQFERPRSDLAELWGSVVAASRAEVGSGLTRGRQRAGAVGPGTARRASNDREESPAAAATTTVVRHGRRRVHALRPTRLAASRDSRAVDDEANSRLHCRLGPVYFAGDPRQDGQACPGSGLWHSVRGQRRSGVGSDNLTFVVAIVHGPNSPPRTEANVSLRRSPIDREGRPGAQ
jgi:hypothetical protein